MRAERMRRIWKRDRDVLLGAVVVNALSMQGDRLRDWRLHIPYGNAPRRQKESCSRSPMHSWRVDGHWSAARAK